MVLVIAPPTEGKKIVRSAKNKAVTENPKEQIETFKINASEDKIKARLNGIKSISKIEFINCDQQLQKKFQRTISGLGIMVGQTN